MIKDKFDKKVEEEICYRTSDVKVFTGTNALIKAQTHQKN
jgi:hypothetical protein